MGGAVLILVLALVGWGILSACDKILSRHYERGQQAQFEKDRRVLRDQSRWFSEDKATFQLLCDLADDGVDIGRIREAWRDSRRRSSDFVAQPTD